MFKGVHPTKAVVLLIQVWPSDLSQPIFSASNTSTSKLTVHLLTNVSHPSTLLQDNQCYLFQSVALALGYRICYL